MKCPKCGKKIRTVTSYSTVFYTYEVDDGGQVLNPDTKKDNEEFEDVFCPKCEESLNDYIKFY